MSLVIEDVPLASSTWAALRPGRTQLELLEEAREAVLATLSEERNRRLDLYIGGDSRARDAMLMHAILLLYKQAMQTLTSTDSAVLDSMLEIATLIHQFDEICTELRLTINSAAVLSDLQPIVALIQTNSTWPA